MKRAGAKFPIQLTERQTHLFHKTHSFLIFNLGLGVAKVHVIEITCHLKKRWDLSCPVRKSRLGQHFRDCRLSQFRGKTTMPCWPKKDGLGETTRNFFKGRVPTSLLG